MKGDFSRRTFDSRKRYSAVLVEQGRLLTDADLEEQHRILVHRAESETAHVVGGCGGPLEGGGFAVTSPDPSTLLIGPGAYYVGGTRVENPADAPVPFPAQPDRHDVSWPLTPGRHAIVLDTWRRLVTALDDPSIREVALGGPTTSAREKVVWQVGAVGVDGDATCADPLPPAEVTTGQLAARARAEAELSSPCLIPPQAGYTGLENQFYRVEVLDSGAAYDLVAAPGVVAVTGFPEGTTNEVTVASAASLAVGDAVEVFRSGGATDPVEGTLARVVAVDADDDRVTLNVTLPGFAPGDDPMLRRVGATFVVSRDNGSVVSLVEAVDGVEVTVHDTGPDDVLGFAVGQLVELTDDRVELEALPRQLHQIADIDESRRVVVLRAPAAPLEPGDPSGVAPSRHPKLRRWDGAGAARFRPDGTAWVHLENGVEVRFVAGHYRSGDYWHFPARAATVDVESGTIAWPQDAGGPSLLPPYGVTHQRCRLALVDVDADGRVVRVDDCRPLFPPLTGLLGLHYVGGDGQEGVPDPASPGSRTVDLPAPLEVRVSNGASPVPGATVLFSITASSNGRLQGVDRTTAELTTDAAGVASCRWQLDGSTGHQVCEARLLGRDGAPVDNQLVRFHATLSTAARVAYDPRNCPDLQQIGARTVQQAIDALCQRGGRDDLPRVRDISWPHAGDVRMSELVERGLQVVFDRPMRPPEGPSIGWWLVALEYDRSDFEADPNELFVRRINPREVFLEDEGRRAVFMPFDTLPRWAEGQPRVPREALCRVVLKSHVLLDEAGTALDGDFLGASLPSGNGTAGGDFESWFTLAVRE